MQGGTGQGDGNFTCADADDQALRDVLGDLEDKKPSLEHRSNAAFTRPSGSNPFQAGQGNGRGTFKPGDMALIDISKVPKQSQPADADRDRYEMSDRNNDHLGNILPNSCDDEVLVSGFTDRDVRNDDGTSGFRTADNPDAFAFDGNSGEFALGADNDLELAGSYEDFSTDPEFIKR